VGSKVGLDALEKKKNPFPFREINFFTLVVRTVVWSLHWPRYLCYPVTHSEDWKSMEQDSRLYVLSWKWLT